MRWRKTRRLLRLWKTVDQFTTRRTIKSAIHQTAGQDQTQQTTLQMPNSTNLALEEALYQGHPALIITKPNKTWWWTPSHEWTWQGNNSHLFSQEYQLLTKNSLWLTMLSRSAASKTLAIRIWWPHLHTTECTSNNSTWSTATTAIQIWWLTTTRCSSKCTWMTWLMRRWTMMTSKRKQSTTMLNNNSSCNSSNSSKTSRVKTRCFWTWREKMRLIGSRPRKLCLIIT